LGGRVGGDEVAVVGDMVGEKCAKPLDIVAPVAVQFAGNGEPGHEVRAGCRHAVPRGMPRNLVPPWSGYRRGLAPLATAIGGRGGGGGASLPSLVGPHNPPKAAAVFVFFDSSSLAA
jgi:hypothetical protein